MTKPVSETVWRDCLESIKVTVSSAVFSTWFSHTHLISLNKENKNYLAELGCPSSYVKTTLENRYFGLIQDSLKKTLNSPCNLSFLVKDQLVNQEINAGSLAPLFNEVADDNSYQNAVAVSRLRGN